MSVPNQDDTWTMPPADQGARLVATAAIGGFAVAAVMIVGGLLALYVVDFDWREARRRSRWHRSRSLRKPRRPLLST